MRRTWATVNFLVVLVTTEKSNFDAKFHSILFALKFINLFIFSLSGEDFFFVFASFQVHEEREKVPSYVQLKR